MHQNGIFLCGHAAARQGSVAWRVKINYLRKVLQEMMGVTGHNFVSSCIHH